MSLDIAGCDMLAIIITPAHLCKWPSTPSTYVQMPACKEGPTDVVGHRCTHQKASISDLIYHWWIWVKAVYIYRIYIIIYSFLYSFFCYEYNSSVSSSSLLFRYQSYHYHHYTIALMVLPISVILFVTLMIIHLYAMYYLGMSLVRT